jgi:hypothetical protein
VASKDDVAFMKRLDQEQGDSAMGRLLVLGTPGEAAARWHIANEKIGTLRRHTLQLTDYAMAPGGQATNFLSGAAATGSTCKIYRRRITDRKDKHSNREAAESAKRSKRAKKRPEKSDGRTTAIASVSLRPREIIYQLTN